MIIRDFTYKGVSLSDSIAGSTRIVIQKVEKDVQLRTSIFDRVNYHGSNSSFTLASGRLFSVSGVIFGDTRDDRAIGQTILNGIIVPESNPTPTNKGFYTLSWKDDSENVVEAQAKVYTMPKYSHDVGSSLIEFSFELYSEEAYYTGTIDKSEVGGYGYFGGVALPSELPVALDGYIGAIEVVNLGNFESPCKIEVVGSIIYPKVYNATSGNFYGVSTTTTDFVLDNRSTSAIIENEGVDVSAYRMDGSKYLSILPGVNNILLLGSDYSDYSTVSVTITFRDTYISS